jgi:hypothetical protein
LIWLVFLASMRDVGVVVATMLSHLITVVPKHSVPSFAQARAPSLASTRSLFSVAAPERSLDSLVMTCSKMQELVVSVLAAVMIAAR